MWPRVLTGVLCVIRNVCFLYSGQIFLVQKMKVFPILACSIFNKVLTENPTKSVFPAYFRAHGTPLGLCKHSVAHVILYFGRCDMD